ncbi:MAG: transporter substrate-binding domain-containing protein, partial [Galactobacter sp.]
MKQPQRRRGLRALLGSVLAVFVVGAVAVPATAATAAPASSSTVSASTASAATNKSTSVHVSSIKAQQAKEAVKGKTFTIATDTTFAPFEFREGGNLVGIDMDIINAIAKKQG